MSENSMEKEKNHLFKKNSSEKAVTVSGEPKKKKKKVWLIVLIIVALLVAVIGYAVKNMTAQVELVSNTVEIEPVQVRDLSNTISLKGTVSGASKTNVMSTATAEVTAVNVKVGDMVTAGDALVTLDKEDIEKQIAELQTSLSNNSVLNNYSGKDLQENLANAQLSQTQSLEDAQKAIERAKNSYQKAIDVQIQALIDEQKNLTGEELEKKKQETMNYISAGYTVDKKLDTERQAISDAETAYDRTVISTNQAVENAQEAIDKSGYTTDDAAAKSRDNLNSLQKQLADCELSAPCGGVVTAVNVSVGDKYTAGQTMITIEDTSALRVMVTVEEADILKVQEGMKAVITTDATGEEELSGTVTRVVRVKNQSTTATATDASASTGYSAEISIDNTELLVGMSAKAKIILQEKGNVLAIPYDLVQYDESGNAYVLVAENNNDGTAVAVKKNINVGEEVDYYIEVTGGDLKEGDQLIYDYTYSIVEGQTFAPEQMYSNQDLGIEADTTTGEAK